MTCGTSVSQHCHNEALRLDTAASFGLLWTVRSAVVYINKCFVPGGATVSTQSYSLHHDPATLPDADSCAHPAACERDTDADVASAPRDGKCFVAVWQWVEK